jgi:hypothetical protein
MKRIIFSALVLMSIIGLQAQTIDSPKSNFQRSQLLIAPFYFFDATFMVSYEHPIAKNGALRITPSITLSEDDYNDSREGFGIDLGYKAFLLRNSRIVNVYVGPYAYYKSIKHTYREYSYYYDDYGYYNYSDYEKISYNNNVFGLGIDTGVKCIFGRFVLDLTLGGGIKYPTNSESNEYKGIAPRANLMFGVTL